MGWTALGTIGAYAAADAALRLEQIGRGADLAGVDEALAALEHEVGRLEPELAAVVHAS